MAIKILYVDDDEALQQLVSMHLSLDGFQVTVAADGAQAIECLESDVYDLVLLDIDMPVKNGLEVLRFVKNRNIEVRSVMLTAEPDDRMMHACAKWGALDYLQKPYNIYELMDVVDRALAEPA